MAIRSFEHFGFGFASDFDIRISRFPPIEDVCHDNTYPVQTKMSSRSPEEDLGIVVLANHQRNLFNYALFYHVINQYLGIPDTNLDKANRDLLANHVSHMASRMKEKEASRESGTRPSLPLQEYTGTYEREYGLRAEVTQSESGHLVLQYGNTMADMEHWHRNEFRATLREPRLKHEGIWFVKFDVEDGSPNRMGVSSEHDISAKFRRLPRD